MLRFMRRLFGLCCFLLITYFVVYQLSLYGVHLPLPRFMQNIPQVTQQWITDEQIADDAMMPVNYTRDEAIAQIHQLPAAYDPYIKDASPEVSAIYQSLYAEFSDASHTQTKRSPGMKEYYVRKYLDNPGAGAVTPNYKPFPNSHVVYYSQWDQRWAYTQYSGGDLAQTGCAPTNLAMVYSSITGKTMTPPEMAAFSEANGYAVVGSGTAWSLMDDGARKLGLNARKLNLDYHAMVQALNQGDLIIILVGPGEFTTVGHFLVLTGVEHGEFKLYDSFKIANSDMTWSFDRLAPQIQGVWAYRK